MGIINDLAIKNRISRLNRAKNDLSNDEDSIRKINTKLNEVMSDVRFFIGNTDSSRIVSKLENLKEPYQSNDSDIYNAKSFIQYEINYLKRQIEE